jgi:ubiquinone/menaquinone biosynthesis C-methylase UbiE
LPDESLDAIFANMYLHHIPQPLDAIREMVRALRPGGRLIITDMDRHPYEWLREELADVWLGFERSEIRDWFEQAGLVNIIVDCSGESCHAESQSPKGIRGEADISIFVAVGTRRVSGVKEAVQAGYGAVAIAGSSCCSPEMSQNSCCGGESEQLISIDEPIGVNFKTDYTLQDQTSIPSEAAEISLGCGNPTALAGLQPGETVLDVGSGGGIDAFLAARKVGTEGRVIGVDMTPAMLERARETARKGGFTQVEFRFGEAERLPVEDESVDVILSNCVYNLVEDKGRAFREAYRVLKHGGRLEISDMVTDGAFLPGRVSDAQNWPGCIFGALPEQEYTDLVKQAGFAQVQTQRSVSAGKVGGVRMYSIHLKAVKPIQ